MKYTNQHKRKMNHFILDLDGTLWDTTQVSAEAYNDALRKDKRSSLAVTPETIKQEFGKTFRDIADDLFPEQEPAVRDELMRMCADSNMKFLAETDAPMLYFDVPGAMEELSRDNRLYIVSNCEAGYIEMFLKKYGLEKYITDIECLGNNGKSKAENIRLLMERNQLEEAVYVGDTMGDFRCAAQAGVPFIFASYGYGEVDGECRRIGSFSELRDI